jgi:hypothetical protein
MFVDRWIGIGLRTRVMGTESWHRWSVQSVCESYDDDEEGWALGCAVVRYSVQCV